MNEITPNVAAELLSHEGVVLEAYKDSVGVWTWGVGVTDASSHRVGRYKDNPQEISRVFEIYEWLLREKYAPSVRKAFLGRDLTESQFAAALSFHYNTGGIQSASWVRAFMQGDVSDARRRFMLWNKPKEIIPRRQKECDLFFDGTWSHDWKVGVYDVRKPSYTPDWRSRKIVDVKDVLTDLFGGNEQ